MATSELAAKLERRKMSCDLPESEVRIDISRKTSEVGFRSLDFPEFTVKEIKQYESLFKQNTKGNPSMEFLTLKNVLQKLGWAQTHVELKKLLQSVMVAASASEKEADAKTNDGDAIFRIELPTSSIDFRTFMLLFKKLKSGEVKDDSIAGVLASVQEIDVSEAGVGGAVNFFQQKVDALNRGASYEQEIREMRDERIKEEAVKKERKAAFRDKQAVFKSVDSAK